ncbi:MAG: hypothetical protein CL534_13560 [Ahrensia sp.]|nr:hypothetical protein [Ahrensia sp.]
MIDIFVERRRTFESIRHYKLKHMLEGLKRAGIDWRLIDQPAEGQGGEAAFLHVDLTDVPADFITAAHRYGRCVNRDASTIRRTLYTRAKVQRDDNFAGPVIVKTVLNSRGAPELRYENRRSFAARAGYTAKKLLIPGYKQRLCPDYEIHDSLEDVPKSVWDDPRLLVERFLPGAMDLPIVKHRYDFFFEVELNTRVAYQSLLCDPETLTEFDVDPDVPQAIRDLREQLNLDFGAIDYFMENGEAIPIDANKTVTTTDSWVATWPAVARHVEEVTDRLIEFARNG